MEYFAGLAVSMAETHVCVMNRDGAVIHEVKVPSTAAGIAAALAQAPACRGLCSRPVAWRQCSTMAWDGLDYPLSASGESTHAIRLTIRREIET
jgi:hypothetical protein